MTAANEKSELTRLGSGEMFNAIAGRYDRLNRIISFGVDKGWRKKLVRGLGNLGPNDRVLDVATGTADVAIDVARARPGVSITGLDPSTAMVSIGRDKVKALDLDARVELVIGDGQDLPYEENSFEGSCISFGIRNVPDRPLCLREMARVTKPGRHVVVFRRRRRVKVISVAVCRRVSFVRAFRRTFPERLQARVRVLSRSRLIS